MSPNVLILRAPGTNCDKESAFAFEKAGASSETLHVNRLLENPRLVERFQILCIPGGFSYGDDVAAGRILAVQMKHHLAGRLAEFKAAGKLCRCQMSILRASRARDAPIRIKNGINRRAAQIKPRRYKSSPSRVLTGLIMSS